MKDSVMLEQAKWIIDNKEMSMAKRIDMLSRLVSTYNTALILGDEEALKMDAELDDLRTST